MKKPSSKFVLYGIDADLAAHAAHVKLVETCAIFDIAHAAYEAAYLARAAAIDAYNSAIIATWKRAP